MGSSRNRTPVCRVGGGCGEQLCLEHTGRTGWAWACLVMHCDGCREAERREHEQAAAQAVTVGAYGQADDDDWHW